MGKTVRAPRPLNRGQALTAVAIVILLAAGALAVAGLKLGSHSLDNARWAETRQRLLWTAEAAVAWSKHRLQADSGIWRLGTLAYPGVSDSPPEPVNGYGLAATFQPDYQARRTTVSGPGAPLPPGYLAGLYVHTEDDLPAPDGTVESVPVVTAGLSPTWTTDTDKGSVSSPGLYHAAGTGETTVSVPAFGAVPVTLAVPAVFSVLPVSSLQPAGSPPELRLSPVLTQAVTDRPVPVTALYVHAASGCVRQVTPANGGGFTLDSGAGWLEPTDYGVLYHPDQPGPVTISVYFDGRTAGAPDCPPDRQAEVTASLTFDLKPPTRLVRADLAIETQPAGRAWFRDLAGEVKLVGRRYN